MAAEVKRLNYFNGQFLREPDFTDEQNYHVQHVRDHARLLHTPGIAEGLEIPNPPAGASAVTVNAGVAYDEDGQRIVLANNRNVELIDVAPGQAVFITIAYGENETDPTEETGVPAKTRWTEGPLIETSASAPADPGKKLVLGRIQRSGTMITGVDPSERRAAGVKGGDLAVRSLMFTSEAIAQTGWVKAQLGALGQADVGGSLRVVGNLIVTGTIQGDIAVGTVQAADLVDNAVTSAKIAEADGTSLQNTDAGSGIKTAHLQDGSVTLAKLAANSVDGTKIANASITLVKLSANSVDGTKIVDGSIGLADLAPNSVDGTKIVDGSIGLADLAPNSVDGTKIANASIGLAHLAANSVDGTKIVDGSIGLAELAANSVDSAKIVDGSVGTNELANGAVSVDKLAAVLVWNGSFTVAASATHTFSSGPNTQTHEFFMISVVPTTANTSVKWDQTNRCEAGTTISRIITVINQSAVTVAFNLKAYRLTL